MAATPSAMTRMPARKVVVFSAVSTLTATPDLALLWPSIAAISASLKPTLFASAATAGMPAAILPNNPAMSVNGALLRLHAQQQHAGKQQDPGHDEARGLVTTPRSEE